MGDRTVIEILRDLYDLANAQQIIESDTGNHISLEDYKLMIADDVAELANLLGINLEEKEN